MDLDRRGFLQGSVALGAAAMVTPVLGEGLSASVPVKPFELDEVTIAQLQTSMSSGKMTAVAIARKYLQRIDEVDRHGPALNSVIELNPDAEAIAASLDAERKAGKVRGPLHGVPVLIKDNIDTADKMMTTAGSLALVGAKPPHDSHVAQRLREAGAVILGKTNLSEWANFRSSHATSGWSGRGGQTHNPYVLDRNPCGSSSGTGAAIAANLCAIGVGTETDGSVVCPSSANGLVGIKPTLGLVSRAGIIPIAHSQDTAGPMTRTVTDAAIMLSALAGVDPRDAATSDAAGHLSTDYTQFLKADGLKGARLGIARQYFGFSQATDLLMTEAIEALKRGGAEIVDPANISTQGKFDDTELSVLLYEFKADLNAYLAGLGPAAPVKSLTELIAFNEKNAAREMPYFGQDLFTKAEAKGPLTDKDYLEALEKNHRLTRAEGIDAVMDEHKLDALVAPTGGPVWCTDLLNGDHFTGGYSSASAVAGYPHITVPAGLAAGLPVGISFFGRAWAEPVLLKIAFAFEQMTKARRPPQFLPTVKF
jgi:amidase